MFLHVLYGVLTVLVVLSFPFTMTALLVLADNKTRR